MAKRRKRRKSRSKDRPSDRLTQCYRQVLIAQQILSVVVVAVAAGFGGTRAAYAAALGAGLAIANSWLAKRSIIKSSELAYRTPQYGLAPVFVSLIQRLVLFAGGVGLGLSVWQLSPLIMLGGYMLLQLAYLACKMEPG